MSGFAALLFDMDGVILDSMQQHAQTWQEVLAAHGWQVPLSFILENEGSLGAEVLLRFMAEHGSQKDLEEPDLEQLQAGMRGLLDQQAELYLTRHAPLVRVFPAAQPLLEALRAAGTPTALVTSSRRALVERGLTPELRSCFSALVCAEDVARHKPHPDPYLAAARALGQDPGRCLVVENAPAGIAAAQAAGATCYAVCSTLPASRLAAAHQAFDDLDQLASHLGLAGA